VTDTPTPTPIATTVPSATPFGQLITRGGDIDFPDDMAMIIEDGCWGCDGGPGHLIRVYKTPSGELHQEDLFASLVAQLPEEMRDTRVGPDIYTALPTGFALTPDASIMAVSFCIQGECGVGGLTGFDANSVSIVFLSRDGGITWTEVQRGGPALSVAAILSDGRILTSNVHEMLGDPFYELDGVAFASPPEAQVPVALGDRILWVTDDRGVVNSDGSLFFEPPAGGRANYRPVTAERYTVHDGPALVFWMIPMAAPGERPEGYLDRWGIAQVVSTDSATVIRRWEIDGYLWRIGWWSYKDDRAAITLHVEGEPSILSPYPALVDLSAGTYNMIMAPFSTSQPGVSSLGRSVVHAVQTGPFARVTGTNSCLRVRAAPSLSGEVLACMADGVLLTDMEDTVDADGQTWARVMTPNGVQGWASTGYLER
jgi:hypothetical protein